MCLTYKAERTFIMKTTKKSFIKKFKRSLASASALMAATTAFAMPTSAISIQKKETTEMTKGMNEIIGILLSICFYAGIALAIYGVYEIIMSFMQQQPEAKTKGIFMTMAGVVLMGLDTIVKVFVGQK